MAGDQTGTGMFHLKKNEEKEAREKKEQEDAAAVKLTDPSDVPPTVILSEPSGDSVQVDLSGGSDTPEIRLGDNDDDSQLISFTSAPKSFSSVTLGRASRYIASLAANVMQKPADEGFLPYYAQRINEFTIPEGVSLQDIRDAIDMVQQAYDELADATDTAFKRESRHIGRLNRKRKKLEVFEVLNELGAQNPALRKYVEHLLQQQFGKGETDLGRMALNAMSKQNFFAGNSMDPHGRRRMGMILEMLKSAEFFAPLKVQRDGTKFSINHGEHKLVSGEVNKDSQTMTFRLDPDCPKEHLDEALVAMADMVASHRQLRDNCVTIKKVSNPEVTLRYCELLLCKHNMRLNITPEVAAAMEQQVAGNPELEERWDFIMKFRHVFTARTGNKLTSSSDNRPPLDEYGFAKEQYTGILNGRSNYRSCLEHEFQNRLRGEFPSSKQQLNARGSSNTATPGQTAPSAQSSSAASYTPPVGASGPTAPATATATYQAPKKPKPGH